MAAKDDASPVARGSQHGRSARCPTDVWVLLPAAQLLTAFLIMLPFTHAFRQLAPHERGVSFIALSGALTSVTLFATPIVWKQLIAVRGSSARPFRAVSRVMIAGRITLALAIILTTDVVVNDVGGDALGVVAALGVAFLIGSSASATTEEPSP